MKVLVTGGFGYLGARVAQYFQERGDGVRILARREPDYLSEWATDYDVRIGDVKVADTLAGCCEDIDVVVHAAATDEILSGENELEALLVNGYGTKNIAEEAALANVGHFIHFSTFHAYGPVEGPITEATLPRPTHSYGLTHLIGEYYLSMVNRRTSLTATSFRISNGYGAPVSLSIPRWTLVINDFCRMAHLDGRIVIKSSGKQHRDFVSIADICAAVGLVAARRDDAWAVYNLGGADSRSILDVARLVNDVYTGRHGRSLPVVVEGTEPREGGPVDYSIEKLRKLGFAPQNRMSEEIDKTLDLLEGAS